MIDTKLVDGNVGNVRERHQDRRDYNRAAASELTECDAAVDVLVDERL
ncbi:MAG: hypothetical protein ABIQ73_10080 [Acidimicrobiales bacterium]